MSVRALLLGALMASASCAAPARQAPLSRPPDLADWHVHVDAGGKFLGAYTIVLRYNPEVAVIEAIKPCNVDRFRGSPMFAPETFASGITRVTALDTHPSRPPDDAYHLLTVTFRRLRPGTLRASATAEKLYDDANRPLQGGITAPQFQHVFP